MREGLLRKGIIWLVLWCFGTFGGAQDPTLELLKELTEAPGASGFEEPVGRVLHRYLSPLVDEIRYDGLGSLVGVKRGSAPRPRIMVAAHMDEVGFLVKYIDPDGFIYLSRLGGWLDGVLLAQRWTILTFQGPILAVSGSKTPHIMSAEERNRLKPWTEVFLDIGARSREEAMNRFGVRPGDPVTPVSPFTVLNGTDLYLAKAWDDRVGLAVLVKALERLQGTTHPNTIFAVGTVQEEVGLRGAQTSADLVQPDLGISLEVGVAADYPGIGPLEAQERIGLGPGIFLHDSGMIPNRRLREHVAQVAEREGIPFQWEVLQGYRQDAEQIQRWGAGVPAVNLTVPTRYLHSHNGLLSRRDFDHAVDLLVALLLSLDETKVKELSSFQYGP